MSVEVRTQWKLSHIYETLVIKARQGLWVGTGREGKKISEDKIVISQRLKRSMQEKAAYWNFRTFKEVICEMFWGSLREYGIGCLSIGNEPLKQHFTSLSPDSSVTGIRQQFKLKLLNGKEVRAFLDEAQLVEALFTVQELYSRIGPECMIALDVALASGGSEAIAESFYSIMGIQKHRCHQSNQIIELRTKLDWLLPFVGNCTENVVGGIAKKFLENHSTPLLRDPRSIDNYFKRSSKSKVVHRITEKPVKY